MQGQKFSSAAEVARMNKEDKQPFQGDLLLALLPDLGVLGNNFQFLIHQSKIVRYRLELHVDGFASSYVLQLLGSYVLAWLGFDEQ